MDEAELERALAAAKALRRQIQQAGFKQAMATSYPPILTADDFAALLRRLEETGPGPVTAMRGQ